MLDVTAPEEVEIQIRVDGKVVWVNIDGVCKLRACRVKKLTIIDERKDHGPGQILGGSID